MVPGIVFADGPAGRRAVVAGAGLDVWKVIATSHACGGSEELLRQSYPWLDESQLRAALVYYEAYPAEIDVRLHREAQWDAETCLRTYRQCQALAAELAPALLRRELPEPAPVIERRVRESF